MQKRPVFVFVTVAVSAIFLACNKKSDSKGQGSANQPPAEPATVSQDEGQTEETADTNTETTETKKESESPQIAAGTAGQAQQQLGIALQDLQYEQYKSPPVAFAQVGTVALETGRPALGRTARSLSSLRNTTPPKDIDVAEQKFSWEPAQDPIKSSEKIRCLMEKSEYIGALAKAMRKRPNFPPDNSDETNGVYTFNVAYRWTTNVKQKDLKTACLSDGSSFGMESQGGGNSTDNKLAKFTGKIATVVTARQTGVDADGKPEFEAEIAPLTVTVWMTIDDALMSSMPGSTAAGGEGGGSAQRNYYVTFRVDETPSLKNPNGKTEFSWTAYKVVDGAETDEIVLGRRIASVDDSGNPTLSFRERLTHVETWGTGESAAGYKMTTEQKASVRYKLAAAGATHGKPYDQTVARTASTFNWTQIPESNTYTPPQDQSGSFSYVWDAATDRSLTKWIPSPGAPQWWGGVGMETFDPTTPVCRDTKNLLANVWSYGLFSPNGKRLQHRTYFTIETDKVDSWGWPVMGGIGTWGMWMYGVNDGETVFIRNDAGDRVSYTYKLLSGSLRDQNYNEVVPASDIELECSVSCPLSNITDGANAYRADAGPHRYRYIAAQRKLVYDPDVGVAGNEEDVVLADSVDNAWLSFNLTVVSNASVSYTWQVNRSRWTNSQMTENGGWFDYYNISGTKTDGGYVATDVSFTCSEGCLKSSLSAADLSASPQTIFLANTTAAAPYCYIYRVASNDWEENYKLYRDTTCNGFDAGTDTAVAFASDVKTGLAEMAMTLAGSSPARTIDFRLEKQEYGATAGLARADNSWFTAPVDVKFQPFTYSSAQHAYPGMSHTSVDGTSTSATGVGAITYNGELSFGNGYLCCIQWAETTIPNAWGGFDWGPVATFRKGVPLTVANTTGKFTAGQEVLIAPTQTQLTSPPVSDCSANLQTQVNGLEAGMALPGDTNLPFTNERERNGAAPTTDTSGDPIQPLQI